MKKRRGNAQQLPYAQELQQRKLAEMQAAAEKAAQTALKLACVALNDTEGLGFYRISRFSVHLMELVDEYYADPELGECQLNRRLEQMGFVIGETGGVQAYADENGNPVKGDAKSGQTRLA